MSRSVPGGQGRHGSSEVGGSDMVVPVVLSLGAGRTRVAGIFMIRQIAAIYCESLHRFARKYQRRRVDEFGRFERPVHSLGEHVWLDDRDTSPADVDQALSL